MDMFIYVSLFFSFLWCSTGGDDPREDLALMAIFFEKIVKSIEN
jgi:hypothetical protein